MPFDDQISLASSTGAALNLYARRAAGPGRAVVQVNHGLAEYAARYAAFAVSSGVEPSQAENARSMIAERLPILSPEEDEQLLRDAGFDGVSLFNAGFACRGCVAYA